MMRFLTFLVLPVVASATKFNPHRRDEESLFGKAYVISVKPFLSKDIRHTAMGCGFRPLLVPAVRPYSQMYKKKEDMIDKVFYGLPKEVVKTLYETSLSAKEIGLIASHKAAMYLIANDNSTDESSWSLILEDDARLNPSLIHSRKEVHKIISKSMAEANSEKSNIIYFGLCGGSCKGLSNDSVVGIDCIGRCAHAYAITKRISRTFFHDIYNNDRKDQHQIDQAMASYSDQKFLLAGPSYKSPDEISHQGILYQCCRDAATKRSGTTLGGKDKNDLVDMIQYRTSFTGRLGNLMFQYAAVAGLCIKMDFAPETCVCHSVTSKINDTLNELPVKEFFETFQIPQPTFIGVNSAAGMNFAEHKVSPYDIRYDPDFFDQPAGTTFSGYFQSYKYFHPHGSEFIREKFKFPDFIHKKATIFLNKIISNTSTDNNIVCIAIRRGDKATKESEAIYRKWALSTDYYFKAIEVFRKKYDRKVTLIVFAGGAFSHEVFNTDRQWVRNTMTKWLSTVSPSPTEIFYDDGMSSDHMASMHAMSLCPNIIVASSSYSWWAAFLSGHSNIIAPKYLHERLGFVPNDYYPPDWMLLDEFDSPTSSDFMPSLLFVLGISALLLGLLAVTKKASASRLFNRDPRINT